NLDALDRTDEAKASLEKLIAANPSDLEAIMALGNVLRGRKQFAECADVYSKGVDTIGKPEKLNWVIYYFRGICFERAKQWAKAEADFKRSLELFPRSAARAQLSRLFVDRPGHQPRRRNAHDQARGRATRGRW